MLGATMTTLDAMARKNRFLKNKEKHGNGEQYIKYLNERPYRLYFDDRGEIVCLTREEVEVQPGWNTYDFDKQKLFELKYFEKELHKYHVIQKEDKTLDVQLKLFIRQYSDQEKNELMLVELGDEVADFIIKITSHEIIFQLSDAAKKQFQGKYPIGATIKGKRIFHFYFSPSENHDVYAHRETVSMFELLTNDVVVKYPPGNFRQYDLFTLKLFDKYVRVNS